MFGRLGDIRNKLRQRKAAREFARLTAAFDRQIAEARAKHRPTRDLIEAKRQFVHTLLAVEVAK